MKFTIDFLYLFVSDGDENKKNIRRWSVRPHNTGGREELLRTIWTGKLY